MTGPRLSAVQKEMLIACYQARDMPEIQDLAVELCGFSKAYRGVWFRPELLAPEELKRYRTMRNSVARNIRSLFQKGYVDMGNEETYGEGIKGFHRRMWETKKNPKYWLGEKSPEFIEREIAYSEEIMNTRDYDYAKELLKGKVRTVGLTEEGVKIVRRLLGESE